MLDQASFLKIRTRAIFDIRYFLEVVACWHKILVRLRSILLYMELLNSKVSPSSSVIRGTRSLLCASNFRTYRQALSNRTIHQVYFPKRILESAALHVSNPGVQKFRTHACLYTGSASPHAPIKFDLFLIISL